MTKELKDLISKNAYDEIVEKLKECVGEDAFEYIFPAVDKALVEGSIACKNDIVNLWLDCDHLRVCDICGDLMEDGWYIDGDYACCDECAAKHEGITFEQFQKWRVYKDYIIDYMEEQGWGGSINDLTQEECDEIIDECCDDCERYFTEWC